MPEAATTPAPIDAGLQLQTITFDFGPLIEGNYPPGTIIDPDVDIEITASVSEGVDSDPMSRLVGSPQIGTAPLPYGSAVVNCAVLQQFGNVPNTAIVYLLICEVTLTSGDRIAIWYSQAVSVPA